MRLYYLKCTLVVFLHVLLSAQLSFFLSFFEAESVKKEAISYEKQES